MFSVLKSQSLQKGDVILISNTSLLLHNSFSHYIAFSAHTVLKGLFALSLTQLRVHVSCTEDTLSGSCVIHYMFVSPNVHEMEH